MIKIVFLGDIVGKIGRHAVINYLPKIKARYKPDLVIANVENLAHGVGFTEKTLYEMKEAGIDFCTSGNHAWKKAGSDEILDQEDPYVIRPYNYPGKKSGVGVREFIIGQNKVIVVNLLGRVFMKEESIHCPFKALNKIISNYNNKDIIIVDFHAEVTSEKNALGQYVDGRVSAILGTHTHVPTCDNKILDQGTAFISDVGMIGYYNSVIGSDTEQVLNSFLGDGKSSKKHDVPDYGLCQFNAIYLEIDNKTGRASKIERLDKIIDIKK